MWNALASNSVKSRRAKAYEKLYRGTEQNRKCYNIDPCLGYLRHCSIPMRQDLPAAHGIAAHWNQVSREAEQKHVSSKPEIPVSPEIKWEDLNAKFSIGSSLTELQKGELWKQYQGKKVRWQGPVREVSDAGLMEIIGDDSPFPSGRQVYVQIIQSEIPKAAKLSRGDRAIFVGVLDSYDDFSFHLANGIIE